MVLETVTFEVGDEVIVKDNEYPWPNERGNIVRINNGDTYPLEVNIVSRDNTYVYADHELTLVRKATPVPATKRKVRFNIAAEVDSSAIKRLCYSTKDKVLLVEFAHGGEAAYENVHQFRFARVLLSESVGRDYNKLIKNADGGNRPKSIPLDSLNYGVLEDPKPDYSHLKPGTPVKITGDGIRRNGQIALIVGPSERFAEISNFTVRFANGTTDDYHAVWLVPLNQE